MAQPTILLVAETDREEINGILEDWGRGPDNITRPVCAVGDAETVTHRVGLDMGADAEYAADLRELAESGEHQFWAYTAAGPDVNGLEWIQTVLSGKGLMLQPDEA